MIGLGASSQLGIGIAIRMENQFSRGAQQVRGELQSLKRQTDHLIDSSLSKYRNSQAAIAMGAGLIAQQMYRVTRASAEFGHKINQVDIVAEGKIGKTRKQLANLAMDIGSDLKMQSVDVTRAMFENAKAGIDKGIESITKFQLAAARATDESVETVARVGIAAHNSFNIAYDQSERVYDAFTYTANATVSSYESLGEAMKQLGFTANSFNMSLEETLALAGRLSQSGIAGSQIGTWMKNAILYLGTSSENPTKKQAKAYAQLGINPKDVAGLINTGRMGDVLDMIDQRLATMTTTARAGTLKDLVNIRGMQAILGASSYDLQTGEQIKNLKTHQSILEGILSSRGITTDQAKRMMNDLSGTMEGMTVAWENVKIKFVEAMAPVLMPLFKGLTWILDNFVRPIAASPIAGVLGSLIMILSPVIMVVTGFRAVMIAATMAMRAYVGMQSRGVGLASLMQLAMGSPRGSIPQMWGGIGMATASMYGRNRAGGLVANQRFTMAGKTYNPGTMVPRVPTGPMLPTGAGVLAFQGPRFNQGYGGLNRIGGAASSRVGMLSRIGSGMGTVATGVGRLLPVVGIIAIGWSIVSGVRSLIAQGAQARQDRMNADREQALKDKAYTDSLNLQFMRYHTGKENLTLKDAGASWYTPDEIQAQKNQLNIFVDGEKKISFFMEQLGQELQRRTSLNI